MRGNGAAVLAILVIAALALVAAVIVGYRRADMRARCVYPDGHGILPAVVLLSGEMLVDANALAGPLAVSTAGSIEGALASAPDKGLRHPSLATDDHPLRLPDVDVVLAALSHLMVACHDQSPVSAAAGGHAAFANGLGDALLDGSENCYRNCCATGDESSQKCENYNFSKNGNAS